MEIEVDDGAVREVDDEEKIESKTRKSHAKARGLSPISGPTALKYLGNETQVRTK
ncbi:MAG: hypothetical protein ACTSUE_17250 [Promethearchaeota archaeon]